MSDLIHPKLPCENCRTDKTLNDIWWCTVCQGTVCSACAMKSHHQHQCTPWENLDVVKECVAFYQSRIVKRQHDINHERDGIHVFCTNLQNDLLDFFNQEIKAREGLRRITKCFTLLTETNGETTTVIPKKLEKKLDIVSKLMKSYNHHGLEDLSFDFNDDRRNYEFQLPKLERIVDLCFNRNSKLAQQILIHPVIPRNVYSHKFNLKSWIWPLVLILMITFALPMFLPDHLYSMEMTSKHNQLRKTPNLHVLFYVKSDFFDRFEGDIKIIEQKIEENYINSLRTKCFDERKTKETLMWRSRMNKDVESYERAKRMRTPNCDRLSDILMNYL